LRELRERVRRNLARFERRASDDTSLTRAAVAVTLAPDDHERPCFLITRRAAKLRKHAGQWALPGGRVDPGETAVEAALRELREEIGLELPQSRVLGLLDDFVTRSGFAITPVVVWHDESDPLTPNPDEVACVFRVPLDELERPGVPTLTRIPESDRPVLSIPLPVALGTTVHAPTAAVIYQLREVALRGLETRVAHYEQPVFAWK